jgi:DNA-binding response OmpR family regulator
MIVDDEPAIGKLLLYQLSGFGYQASYVEDGLLALQRLLVERPDLVLLDVMMPRISGWEICRQIRACSSIPIIMLTAKGADPDIVTGLRAGADDYMIKPFSMNQLQARIEAVLRRSGNTHAGRDTTRAVLRVEPQRSPDFDAHPANPTNSTPSPAAPPNPGQPLRLGQHIRETRLAQGLSLHQVERACGIRWEFLQAIEQENWSYMPHAELRHTLRTYADYLGLNLQALIGRPEPARPQPLIPLHLAAALALIIFLVVIGLYLL